MNNSHDYRIAGLVLRSEIDIVATGIRGFKPFEVEGGAENADCTFGIRAEREKEDYGNRSIISTSYLAEADADSYLAKVEDGYLYVIERKDDDRSEALFHINTSTNAIESNLECHTLNDVSLLRFGIWIMFGIVLAPKQAIAIHSSVIESSGRGTLFLGESGTGKSTHTRLWRENIEGARLLNDDSPIVRIVDGEVRVFGSPWSGKTPCYKSLDYPIAGFCRLSQAPHNAIRRLNTIAAIGALLPSCPPQFAHDEYLQDCICSTLGTMLKSVPVYHLECLPDAAAAELSHSTIVGHE